MYKVDYNKLYDKYIPQLVKIMREPIMSYIPTIFYMEHTLFMHLKGRYHGRWGHGSCPYPLLDEYEKYESLFERAGENFKEIITPFTSEYKWLIGRIYNGFFQSVDVELYFSVIRKYQPKLLIEIGSGHSTYFALDAMKKNGRGNIISIDPEPRVRLSKHVKHIGSKVEEVNVNIFKKLSENDIVFIDSSHTTEEAAYHTEEILPILSSGVIIHHHDIFYPYRAYQSNNPTVFGEPDVVLNFYLENRSFYEIITSSSYVVYRNLNLVKDIVRSFDWNSHRSYRMLPSSLYVRKR